MASPLKRHSPFLGFHIARLTIRFYAKFRPIFRNSASSDYNFRFQVEWLSYFEPNTTFLPKSDISSVLNQIIGKIGGRNAGDEIGFDQPQGGMDNP